MKEDLEPEISEKIEESLKMLFRLQSLINSLLLIARIESQQCLREETFSINEILSEIIDEIRPIAEDKQIQIIKDFDKDFIFTHANRSLVFSMFYNIVNNAVKNTDTGSVSIRSSNEKNRFKVTVTDTGKGMSPEQLDTLFSRFKTRISNEPEGTGIGLAIAKSIAEFHNILITVDSVISKGSCFSFMFPVNS
jgi:signal transduction histidine kinase